MIKLTYRNDEIDLVRTIAIIMVIVHHLGRGMLKNILPDFLKESWTGVDLFFLISGYLVTNSFASWLENIHPDAKLVTRISFALKYSMRRLVRILPAAWAWAFIPLLGTLVIENGGGFGPPNELLQEFLAVVTLRYNYFAVASGFGYISHFWSLAVEEHFYLFLPIFLLILPSRISQLLGLLLLAALCQILRYISWKSGTPFGSILFLTHFRADGLSIGCMLGLLTPELKKLSIRLDTSSSLFIIIRILAIFALIYLWISPFLLSRAEYISIGFVTFALSSAVLVASASVNKGILSPSRRALSILATIGKRSYSLYLVHLPILILLREFRLLIFGFPRDIAFDQLGPLALEFLIFFLLLCGVTEVNFRFLELPLIRFAQSQFRERPYIQSRYSHR